MEDIKINFCNLPLDIPLTVPYGTVVGEASRVKISETIQTNIEEILNSYNLSKSIENKISEGSEERWVRVDTLTQEQKQKLIDDKLLKVNDKQSKWWEELFTRFVDKVHFRDLPLYSTKVHVDINIPLEFQSKVPKEDIGLFLTRLKNEVGERISQMAQQCGAERRAEQIGEMFKDIGENPIKEPVVVNKSFEEARNYAHSLKFSSSTKWYEWAKSGQKPKDIPLYPHSFYKKEWKNWPDWLGTKTMPMSRIRAGTAFLPYEEAQQFIKNVMFNGKPIKTWREWREYRKSSERPSNIPTAPDHTYKGKGWTSWHNWLGTDKIAGRVYAISPLRRILRQIGLAKEIYDKY